MLLYVGENNIIGSFNGDISREDAESYLGTPGYVWFVGTFPEVDVVKGKQAFYIYRRGEILVEYADIIPPPATPEQLYQQQLADLEIRQLMSNIQSQEERQLLAQQITDLELLILGGGVG